MSLKPPKTVRAVRQQTLEANAGDEVDAQLARYRSMRDFTVTAEPSGNIRHEAAELPFVVQKHAATRLHYDFRLGWHGVLKSWACAKGPSYNVHDKRLAVEVEDHPMEYGGFEGIIPRGQYGGGTVMVWDQGTWTPHVDVDEGLRKGNLKFALRGTKLNGNWALVRMGGKAAQEDKPNWLLIKEHDETERADDAAQITEEAPDSAVTGRSLEQIAEAGTHVWNSKETAGTGQAWYRQRAAQADAVARPATTRKGAAKQVSIKPLVRKRKLPSAENGISIFKPEQLSALPKESLPEFVKPQLAAEGEAPPSGSDWVHELKLDGYRVQARKRGKTVQLLTRTGLDWTHRMKPVEAAIQRLAVRDALVDGEVVVLDATGVSSFARLQASFEKGESHPMTYFAFDLLHLDGRNTRGLPLLERKRLLKAALPADDEELRFGEHLEAEGEAMFHQACVLHAEGIISKKKDAKYTSGRGHAWLKSKCLHEQEFVVGGYTDLSNGTRGIGALLLGYYDEGKLIYAGRTGTGFNARIHAMLRNRMESVDQKGCAFAKIPNEARRGAHWVKPETVVQVRFATWTGENQLRQAAYLGLREDKPAREVRKEDAAPTPKRAKDASKPGRERLEATGSAEGKVPATNTKAAHAKTAVSEAMVLAAANASLSRALPIPAVRLTHQAKVVDAQSGVTKQQLAAYLFAVSGHMLPHITDRPLSLVRCPEGSGKPCFYQKHVNHMLPAGVGSVMVSDKKGGTPEPYITLNTAESLAGLAQMSVLEIHPWGSTNTHLEYPNRVVIDLDPDESLPWSRVAESAIEVRTRLKKLGLESFVKTTGGKGLHIVFPMQAEYGFATMKAWAHGFVQDMEKANPRLYLSKMTKSARVGKIYLDYLRNERGATAVAPFSMRARPGLPCSVTLDWKELSATERPLYRIDNFQTEWQERLKRDPWRKMFTMQQTISRDVVERFAGKQAKATP